MADEDARQVRGAVHRAVEMGTDAGGRGLTQKLASLEDASEALELDEVLTALHVSRHNVGRAKYTTFTTRADYSTDEREVSREMGSEVFEAIEAHLDARIAKTEADIRALGFEPSKWTPPKGTNAA